MMADTTAMFVVGLYHYFQWTGDQATLDRLWPAAKRAMAWVMVDSTKGLLNGTHTCIAVAVLCISAYIGVCI